MGLAALIASCSDDDRNNDTDNQHLVSPSMAVSISNTDGRQSPFTGILTIMPCIIRKSKFPQNPKRSVRFSGKGTKRSVQKRKARNTQKTETKGL